MTNIITDPLHITTVTAEDQLLAFADHMALAGSGQKKDYLRVRREITSMLAYLEQEQKDDKARERALVADGQAESWAYVDSRRERHARRGTITAWIRVSQLSRLWAAHAYAGDPQLITQREARCAELHAAAKATHHARKAESTAAYKIYEAASAATRRAGEEERLRTHTFNTTQRAEDAAVKALRNAEERMNIAKAAVAASALATELNPN